MMSHTSTQTQAGFVLITAMVFLVILTLLALGGESVIGAQTRIAANEASQQAAFETAEQELNALSYSTGWQANCPIPTAGTYVACTAPTAPSGISTLTIEVMCPVTYSPGSPASYNCAITQKWYRITVTATQASGGMPVILQSIVM